MNMWLDIEVRKEQQKDLLREAQQRREARQQHEPARQPYAPALARIGRWLHAWGARLEARYSAPDIVGETRQPAH
jgi:hypothetical protein